jgi:hypothetical protein
MTRKVVGLTPLVLRLALVTIGFAALAFICSPATAQVYTNATNHYHLTVPDNWNASEDSNSVSFNEGLYSSWTISLSVGADANAKNTSTYTVGQTTTQCDTGKGMLGGTYVTAPHAITGAGGRPGGECVYDYSIMGSPYRVRVTIFASDAFDKIYIIQANDNATHYPTIQSVWDTAASSFALDGEPAPTGSTGGTGGTGNNSTASGGLLSGTTLYVIIIVVVLAVVGAVVMMRRGKGKKGADQPPAGQAPAAPAPPKK